MRRYRLGLCILVAGLAACHEADVPTDHGGAGDPAFARSRVADEVASDWLFRFERLAANEVTCPASPATPCAGAIRDRRPAGMPWKLERGEARLSQRGELRVKVKGLVLQSTGSNPGPAFGAVLSCRTVQGNALTIVDVSTALVAVGPDGNAEIRELLSGIPSPCYAPVVFVTGHASHRPWLAVSGF